MNVKPRNEMGSFPTDQRAFAERILQMDRQHFRDQHAAGAPLHDLEQTMDQIHEQHIRLALIPKNRVLRLLARLAGSIAFCACYIVFPIFFLTHIIHLIYFTILRLFGERAGDLVGRLPSAIVDFRFPILTFVEAAWGTLWWGLGLIALWGAFRAGLEAGVPPRRGL